MKRKILAILLSAMIVFTIIAPTVSTAFAAEGAEESSTVRPPANRNTPQTALALPMVADAIMPMAAAVDKKDVLLIQTSLPWDSNSNTKLLFILQLLGYINGYDVCTVNDFNSGLDVSVYNVIMFANDQTTATYQRYEYISNELEFFARSGGAVIFGACDEGWGGEGHLSGALPGGVQKTNLFQHSNYIADNDHPIVTGELTDGFALTNANLQGNYCSHTSFLEDTLPVGSNVILRGSDDNKPTLVEYPLGDGKVIASGLTWEYYYPGGPGFPDSTPNYSGAYFSQQAFDDLVVYSLCWKHLMSDIGNNDDNYYSFRHSGNSFFANYDSNKKAEYTYEISDTYFNYLTEGLSASQKGNIRERRDPKDGWGGSCFGMGSTLSFFFDGRLNVSTFDKSARFVSQLKQPSIAPVTGSMINYYQLSQYHPSYSALKKAKMSGSTNTRLKDIVDQTNVSDWNYVSIQRYDGSERKGGHLIIPHGRSLVRETFLENLEKEYWKIEILEANSKANSFLYIDVNDTNRAWFDCDWGWGTLPSQAVDSSGEHFRLSYVFSNSETSAFFQTINLQNKINAAPNNRMFRVNQFDNQLSGLTLMESDSWKTLRTNYDSFSISDGTTTVIVTGGDVDSDSIQIFPSGSEDGPNEYFIYGRESEYIITPLTAGLSEYLTSILFESDDGDGLYLRAATDVAIPVTFKDDGSVEATALSPAKINIASIVDTFSAPWSTVEVSAESQTNLLLRPINELVYTVSTSDASLGKLRITGSDEENNYYVDYPGGSDTSLIILEKDGAFGVVSEDEEDIIGKAPVTFTAIFDTNTGSVIPSVYGLLPGDLIPIPNIPVRNGYSFNGWFTEKNGEGIQWDFDNDAISGDITLYAYWTVDDDAIMQLGDVNQDGVINAADASLVMLNIVGKAQLTEKQLELADINEDGEVNSADAALILVIANNKTPSNVNYANVTLQAGNKTAHIGEYTDIPITLSAGSNSYALEFDVEYDDSVLEFDTAQRFNMFALEQVNYIEDGKIKLSYANDTALAAGGLIANLTFKVLQECDPATEIVISDSKLFGYSNDLSLASIPLTALNGFVGAPGTITPVTGISLDKDAIGIRVGESAQVIATVLPSDATNAEVTWYIEDSTISTISSSTDSTCTVRGLKAGSTKLVAFTNDGGYVAEAQITVTGTTQPPPPPGSTFTITASAEANGSISPSGTISVARGSNQTFTITASSGYKIADLLVDGGSVGAVATYTFSDVTASHSISATFARDDENVPDPNTPLWLNPFIDVSEGDWFFNDVAYVHQNGLMQGTAADRFGPNIALTRGMAVTVLYRIEGEPDVSGLPNPFSDVAEGQHYTNAVKWAADEGLVQGYASGKFGPEDLITRQDLAVIIDHYTGYKVIKLSEMRAYQKFSDDADIANYAKEAVETFFKAGLINGKTNNKFDPKGQATRAEYAAIIHRVMEAADSEE